MRDHLGRPVVVVTGMGAVTSLGSGVDENWTRMLAGESGIRRISRFPTTGLSTTIAGTVDHVDADHASDRSFVLGETAAREACAQAGIAGDVPGPLLLATPPVEMEWGERFALHAAGDPALAGYARLLDGARRTPDERAFDRLQFAHVADRLHDALGTRGMPISLSTACASGATAIQLGAEAIRRGDTDLALCVGTDGSVHIESLVRFALLSALSTDDEVPEEASKPFSKDRDGFVMAEGAGAVVLESYEGARARGAKVLAVLRGCGERADHFHRTRSSPDGSPAIATIAHALGDADLAPDAIDTVNAHGTATPENDRIESIALHAVFGERARSLPLPSSKSMIGHTLTAAGAVEAVVSCMTLIEGRVPPTINHDHPDPDIRLDVVTEARDVDAGTVLSNSFGFGGQNACLVFATEPAA